MANGQRPTVSSERPTVLTHALHFNFDPVTEQYIPLFVSDKAFVVEKAIVRYTANAGTARTGKLVYAADGAALSTNTEITAAMNFNDDANELYTFILVPNTTATGAACPTANLVPANSLLGLAFNGAADAALGVISLTIYITEVIQ